MYEELKKAAEACKDLLPLRYMESHGSLYIRNDCGIVFDVHQNRSFPDFMAHNKAYADLALAANPSAVLALIAEVECLKREENNDKIAYKAAIERQQELRESRTDWQAECLKKGFEYIRESDDHYVLADVPEMAALLADLLGVEVRDKENHSYGETVSSLNEQIDSANNAFHRAYEAEKECEALRKDAERYRLIRNREHEDNLHALIMYRNRTANTQCIIGGKQADAVIDRLIKDADQ